MIPLYRECRTAEADVGMRRYLCDSDGTGGHLKTEPEDFIVREISDPPVSYTHLTLPTTERV